MIKITLEFDSYSAAAEALARIDGKPRAGRGTSTEEAEAAEIPGVKSTRQAKTPEQVQAVIAKANADSAARREAPPEKPAVTVEDATPDAPAGSAEVPAAFEYATLRAVVNKIGAALAPAIARPALTDIAKSFGAETFTALTPDQWKPAYDQCVALAKKSGVQL